MTGRSHRATRDLNEARILPRHQRFAEAVRDEEKITRIVAEAGPAEDTSTVQRATLAGDSRRLRGIPVCANGVGGTSPGTDPLGELIRKEAFR